MQVCHPSKHTCVPFPVGACFVDSDCTSPTASRCDVGANHCVACRVGDSSDKSCAGLGLGAKTQCLEVAGVAQCIECQQNLDCSSDRPICDGSCAWNGPGSTGRIVYAHNTNASCSDTDPAFGFRFSEPVCNLTRAFTLARDTGRRYVRVLGTNYDPVNAPILYGNFSFIGAPSKNNPAIATMKGRGLLFDVQDTGRLTIEQLDMTEQNVDATALSCSGNGADKVPGLSLQRSILRGSTTPAFPSAGTAAIRLNLIAGNISTAIDLAGAIQPTQKFLIRFNTIAYNGRQPSPRVGGLRCTPMATPKPQVSSNILFGNFTINASQIQLGEGCSFASNVVGSADSCAEPGLRKNNPEFDESFVLKDNPANRACCIDQAMPAMGETFPQLDLLFQPRPSGVSYDIGAFELKQP